MKRKFNQIEIDSHFNWKSLLTKKDSFWEDLNEILFRFNNIVFVHQLYTINNDRTFVDEMIESLRSQNKSIKILFYDMNSNNKTYSLSALIKTDAYLNIFKSTLKSQRLNDKSFERIHDLFGYYLQNNSKTSITKREILSQTFQYGDQKTSLTSQEIDKIVELGFLRLRASSCATEVFLHSKNELKTTDPLGLQLEEAYWLALPNLSQIIVKLGQVENQITNHMRRSMYKEISEKKLIQECLKSKYGEKKKTRIVFHSPFHPLFHIMDLIGRSVVFRVEHSAKDDNVLRLCK